MTLLEACETARIESLKGYVQHVNKGMGYYYVSDWYSDTTVASYENGYKIS